MTSKKFTFVPESIPLPGFTIKRGIQRGGFGEVYYAISDGGKEVALKLLHSHVEVERRAHRPLPHHFDTREVHRRLLVGGVDEKRGPVGVDRRREPRHRAVDHEDGVLRLSRGLAPLAALAAHQL